MRSIAQRIRLGRFNWLYRDRKYNQACRDVHEYIDPIIKKAISYRKSHHAPVLDDKAAHPDGNPDERYVFLYELAKETGNESELRDQVLNILIAGRDTTASLLSSLLFVLAHRQDILSKVRNQIAFLQGRAPTFEDIKDMKYIKFAVNEALRLYPPVPLNARIANKDTSLPLGGGSDGRSPIFVRKGRIVIYQIYATHRRPDLWGSDADDFKPERWESARPGFEYLPFNGGPRICLGK
jgi:cytochrome P450